jgi:hypothetical protein
MDRILAKCVGGGVLDGKYFSTPATNDRIEGFNDMPENAVYLKQPETLRDFAGEEKGLVANLFDKEQHDLRQLCEFLYSE